MTITLFPKKFADGINVEIDAHSTAHCIVSLSKEDGTILKMLGLDLYAGVNKFQIEELEELSAGPYEFEIANRQGKSIFSTKLIKQ